MNLKIDLEINMGAGEWYIEKNAAQQEYNMGRIDRDMYEQRSKFAIGMIDKCGDTEVAIRMAKAHAYDMNELREMVR